MLSLNLNIYTGLYLMIVYDDILYFSIFNVHLMSLAAVHFQLYMMVTIQILRSLAL